MSVCKNCKRVPGVVTRGALILNVFAHDVSFNLTCQELNTCHFVPLKVVLHRGKVLESWVQEASSYTVLIYWETVLKCVAHSFLHAPQHLAVLGARSETLLYLTRKPEEQRQSHIFL